MIAVDEVFRIGKILEWCEKMEKKEKKEKPTVDLGMGFGGLLKGLGDFMDTVSKMAEEGKSEFEKVGEISFDKAKKLKGMYGISVRIGGAGIPIVEKFGTVPKTDVREPMVDVFDEEDVVRVIAELPGVEESDIKTVLEENILKIRAERGDRKYKKDIELPAAVKGELKSRYKNGVLEIELEKS
ncbi:MAG: Hsp20/alpha crystallin family protein [Methanophagales archaeon]|nr:Hsp20/alpha crystallin family protein [Methanophagales archaeon]